MDAQGIRVGQAIGAIDGGNAYGADAFAGPGAVDTGIAGFKQGLVSRVHATDLNLAMVNRDNDNVRKVLDNF